MFGPDANLKGTKRHRYATYRCAFESAAECVPADFQVFVVWLKGVYCNLCKLYSFWDLTRYIMAHIICMYDFYIDS